jgi:hypothetical protein
MHGRKTVVESGGEKFVAGWIEALRWKRFESAIEKVRLKKWNQEAKLKEE